MARRRERVLIFGPVGETPWQPLGDVAASLQSLGYEALVDSPEQPIIGFPAAYVPSQRAKTTRTYLVLDRVLAYLAWMRQSRRTLRDRGVDQVLVWSAEMALLARLASPRGVAITWVVSDVAAPGRWRRARRAGGFVVAQRVVLPHPGASRWSLRLARVAAQPHDGVAIDEPRAGGATVVLADHRSVDLALASGRRADAVVVDARRGGSSVAEPLREATVAQEVVFACDDAWADDGAVDQVVDPALVVRPDFRHWAALARGAAVDVPANASVGALEGLRLGEATTPGWRRLHAAEPIAPRAVEEWWHDALGRSRRAQLCDQGVPVDKCPACGTVAADAVHDAGDGVTVRRCRNCRLRYSDLRMAADALFDDGYHDATGAFGPDYANDILRDASERIADLRLDLLARWGVPARGALLDVGAGLGHMVARANRRGFAARGLEPSAAAARYAAATFGVDVAVGTVEEYAPQSPAQVVTVCHTLEHIAAPYDAIARLRRLVRPDGWLYIEVPNVASAARVIQGKHWLYWQPGDHVVHFDKRRLQKLLGDHGFAVTHTATSSLVFDGMTGMNIALAIGALSADRILEPGSLTSWLGARLSDSRATTLLRGVADVIDRVGWGQNLSILARPQ